MNRDKHSETIDYNVINFLVPLIIVAGVVVRFLRVGSFPGGVNQDEAFAGYEAYSLLKFGMDSSGHHFPVYLNTWGSGMNALNTYLMMPFISVLGLKTWVIRLPQCIVACFTLFAAYKLIQEIANSEMAMFCTFFLTISPWHIMLARWGLESNLAPGFVLFGLYFFIRGVDESKFFMLSALMYGLSLYCYATIWPIVPIILVLQLVYLIVTGYFDPDRFVWISAGILFIMALPLLLFILVNKDLIAPIETGFISIPKLTYMRDSEVSFAHIPENFVNMISILIKQDDGLYWNSPEIFGLYYRGSLLLSLVGMGYSGYHTYKSFKEKTFEGLALLFPTLIGGLILGCLIYVNINRMNIIHIPILLFAGIGLYFITSLLSNKFYKYIWIIVMSIYSVICISFTIFYFSTYQNNIDSIFDRGLDEAVEHAMEIAGNDKQIYVDDSYLYSKILFYSKMPVTTYIETVEYTNYPSPYLDISKCGNFNYGIDYYSQDNVYILPYTTGGSLRFYGWTADIYDNVCVAYYKE